MAGHCWEESGRLTEYMLRWVWSGLHRKIDLGQPCKNWKTCLVHFPPLEWFLVILVNCLTSNFIGKVEALRTHVKLKFRFTSMINIDLGIIVKLMTILLLVCLWLYVGNGLMGYGFMCWNHGVSMFCGFCVGGIGVRMANIKIRLILTLQVLSRRMIFCDGRYNFRKLASVHDWQ